MYYFDAVEGKVGNNEQKPCVASSVFAKRKKVAKNYYYKKGKKKSYIFRILGLNVNFSTSYLRQSRNVLHICLVYVHIQVNSCEPSVVVGYGEGENRQATKLRQS